MGQNTGTLSSTYATGAVTSLSGGEYDIGGLVGIAQGGTISNSYATGAVSSGSGATDIGGPVGLNLGFISSATATGAVSGGSNAAKIGGLVGWNYGAVSASYWDITASGQSTSASGTGLATASWLTSGPMSDPAWTANSAWNILPGHLYPLLSAFPTVTVSGSSASMIYGANALPSLSVTVGAASDGSTATVTGVGATAWTTATKASSVGSYGTYATGGTATAGYQIDYVAGYPDHQPQGLDLDCDQCLGHFWHRRQPGSTESERHRQ